MVKVGKMYCLKGFYTLFLTNMKLNIEVNHRPLTLKLLIPCNKNMYYILFTKPTYAHRVYTTVLLLSLLYDSVITSYFTTFSVTWCVVLSEGGDIIAETCGRIRKCTAVYCVGICWFCK